jgi:hypothetical protein
MAEANSAKHPTNGEEITLKDVILKLRNGRKYLFSKWKIILLVGVLGGAVGFIYACFKKDVYTAQLNFALQDDNSSGGGGFGSALGIASQFGINLGTSAGGAFSGDNLMEVMKSRYIIENTLLADVDVDGKRQTLAELYISFNKLRDDWEKDKLPYKNVRFLPGSDRSKFTVEQNSLLGSFYRAINKKMLTIDKLDKKVSIIAVKFESNDELFSKNFVEVLVKNVSDFYIASKTKKTVQNVNILQRQTDSIRRELNAAITGVALSTDVNPNPNPSLQIIKVPSARRQVDVQADQAILTQLVANLELAKITLRKETPLIQVIDRPILPLDRQSLGKVSAFIFGAVLGLFVCSFFLLVYKIYRNIIR